MGEGNMTKPSNATKTIDEYMATFPDAVRNRLEELRRVIRESAPQSEEAISYGIPTFKLNGNLVHFAAFKNHIGFYPTPSAIKAFRKELSPYKQAKGSVQFPMDEPLPLGLEKRIVAYRVRAKSATLSSRPRRSSPTKII